MIFNELYSSADFKKILSEFDNYKKPVALFGLSQTARASFIAAIQKATNRKVVVITKDERSANRLLNDVYFFNENSQIFHQRDLTLRPLESFSREYEYRRIKTLGNIIAGKCDIVIAPVDAALMYTMPKEEFIKNTITIKSTTTIKQSTLLEHLLSAGYIRRDMVTGAGQVSVRGDIMDLYTPDMPYPVRIEFWGDVIDRINTFDLETQRRLEQIKKVHISPVKEVLFKSCEDALSKINTTSKGLTSAQLKHFEKATEREVLMLEDNIMPSSMDKYLSLCYEKNATFFDYIEDPIIFIDEPNAVKESYNTLQWHLTQDIEALLSDEIIAKNIDEFYEDYNYFLNLTNINPTIIADDFMRTINDYNLSHIINITCNTLPAWSGEYKVLIDDVQHLVNQNYKIVILAGTDKSAKNLAKDLTDNNFNAVYSKDEIDIPSGNIVITSGHTRQGFELKNEKLCLITSKQLDVAKKKVKKQKNKDALTSIEDISKGDYVVHQNYGIGVYDGIHNVNMQGVTKDYLKILFQGKDSLFVPVTQLDLISRYTYAQEDEKVKLSKLGTDSWNKTKQKAKKATEEMAKELIMLYAEREKTKGIAFSPDTEWQKDFEGRFIYEETDDQLRAISEIKRDMQSNYPMQRLLCGDVGVGKTEVALRAAFKAVMESKQVAILVPTTVLAWQHYNTLVQRMENFPVNIQLLSRFRTPKQRSQTIKDINNGVADIVVGTHALIQKSVQFKNLGLVIIDEEQRFGVAHKEKLVENFKNVDVLTLSATPIPRTLSMALNGIRDMSTITQPPFDRIPIETYVSEYDEQIIAAALNRELNRSGQCYYLHNRVETIDICAQRVQKMAPDANIGIAHGKMDEATLSAVWQQLINGEIDILVCTTIIETGIDVPNCNTLVIENADSMGLSQLYQIRGRVGRSTRKSYAYFTFRKDKVLTEIAVKRLSAIKEFTSFGSGFKIAMRDLQIRGAGSILGKTQSGFMASIGYDLYIKLLNQAIAIEKGEEVKTQKSDCVIDIEVDAFIPEKYIPNTQNRIEIYKRIAALENEDSVSDLLDELIDRYGDVPKSVIGLIDISILRVLAANLGITEILQRRDSIMFYSNEYSKINMIAFLKDTPYKVNINSTEKAYIAITVNKDLNPINMLKDTVELLNKCKVNPS